MSHSDPYVSTETLRQLCQPTSATRQTKNSREDATLEAELDELRAARAEAIREDAELEAELATIRAEARRIGRLLVRIPFLDMMFFFVRVFFALFFATLVYLFLWWLLLFASAGAGFSLLHVLARLLQLPGY